MKKTIDFRHFKVFTDISQKESNEVDIAFQVADLLYKKSNGIVAHELAHRIYEADGPVEFTQEELDALKPFIEEHFTPLFIDSFKANIK